MTEPDHEAKAAKGFAGLSSLVSKLDLTETNTTESEPTSAAANKNAPDRRQPEPGHWNPVHDDPIPPRPSAPSPVKWFVGAAAIMGLFWFFSQENNKPIAEAEAPAEAVDVAPAAPTYKSPVVPDYSASAVYTSPSEAQVPSRPKETMPPVGQDLILSHEQIIYCLAEDMRLDGAKSAVNNYSDADVNSFNAMVGDYNSRCSSFRYRAGALQDAQQDLEPFRGALQAEGQARFSQSQ